MSAKSFYKLVASMRRAQKEYFKYRTRTALTMAKNLEKQVDEEIERAQVSKYLLNLFND